MENLLMLIVRDASSAKFADIRNICQELHDFLEAQQGTIRAPPHELREKCVSTLKLALDSHNSKLIAHAVSGFQKLLRDDRFQSNFECEQEEQWLPCQLLAAIGSIKSHPEDTQVELLKILLNMACSTWWSMNEAVILRILRACQEAYVNSSPAVKIAAQATASQTIWAFCNHLQNEDKINQKNPYLHAAQKNEDLCVTESAFNNLVPILQYLCRKLQQKPRNNNLKERVIPFYLETLLSLVSVLPGRPTALKSYPMQDYLWKEFCPTLLSLLGNPKTDNMMSTSSQKQNVGVENQADGALRRSNVFAASPVLTSTEAKTVYNIAIELVRLAGPFRALRPMLESVFHRILLYTSPAHRLEALKATKDILKKPERLLCFGGLPLFEDEKAPCSTDLGLIKLAIAAFVECSHCNDSAVCYQSVDCVVALLDSLEQICEGQGLSTEQINQINDLYTSLESTDYTGPMTYQSWEKLKKLSEIKGSCHCDQSEMEEDEGEMNSEITYKEGCRDCGDEDEVQDDSDDQLKSAEGDSVAKELVCSDTNGESLESTADSIGKIDNDIPSGYETDSSGSTEGPEEDFNEIEDPENVSVDETEVQAARRQRIPKTLLGIQDGEAELERVAQLYETRDLYAQQERNNARYFVSILKNLMPKLLLIKSSIEADAALQEFASKYCEEVMSCQNSSGNKNSETVLHHMIVNADGVYLATYSSLALNLKLVRANYYHKESLQEPPLTEEQFIENVHGSGVLVYLSATWLAELYQQILVCDLLTISGYDITSSENFALINLLTDLEGLNSGQPGSYLLSDYFRLEKTVVNDDSGPDVQAGRKFARRILTGCWDGIIEVLSVLLNGKNAIGLSNALGLMLGTEGAKEEHRRARDAVANCLDGLQKAARLSNILSVHSRCEAVFALLAAVSCPVAGQLNGMQSRRKRLKSSVMALKTRPMKLHASHVLSMDVILSRGLELGSYSPDCWKHVFRCCIYLAELEHSFFSKGLSLSATPKRSTNKENDTSEDCLQFPAASLHPACISLINIPEFVKENVSNLSTGGILSSEQSLQALCALSQIADRLFDDAAYKLNRRALLDFLNALCFASQATLFATSTKATPNSAKASSTTCHSNVSLLHRTADVMLKCIKSGRPLIHVMQAWSIVGLHLMEAACHKDQDVAKRAVASIHDIVNTLLASQSELPYFHFNEALFKPFENLLCLELCDNDIQDQIISSICEFVEGCTTEIRSGWRPLFGALRTVRPTTNSVPAQENANEAVDLSSNHIRVVLDVFEAFLNTENVLVFANAAVDCILCLLKHIKGEFGGNSEVCVSSAVHPDFCLESLKYLHKCCSILASMQKMPSCPIFHASSRIQFPALQFIDPDIPGISLVQFDKYEDLRPAEIGSTFCVVENFASSSSLGKQLTLRSFQENLLTLEQLESPSGILHVWCLIFEGLIGTIVSSQKSQSCTMETLFDLLQKIYELPGVEFGLYILNHLLLPSIQSWLRRTSRIYRGWDNFASQFKQCCGQVTDLVVDYIVKLAESDLLDSLNGVKLMLYQLLQLLIECVAQPTESISRLGCSCIRHIIVTSGPFLVGDLWDIVCQALHRACNVSLFSVKQLMVAFRPNSDNFYGDIGQVKVAAKSDCSPEENERLKQLAQQVFLLDNQRSVPDGMFLDDPIDDDRSYIFLLYPPWAKQSLNSEVFVVKIPFRCLVVGLLSHQILLQTIGAILLQGLPHIVPSLANILLQSPAPTSASLPRRPLPSDVDRSNDEEPRVYFQLPGMMQYLSRNQLSTLLHCLEDSYKAACEFDTRPGLKFLVQKVARANAAANLYKQTGASWTIRSIVLLELCLHYQQFSSDAIAPKSIREEAKHFADKMKEAFSEMCNLYAELFVKKEGDCFDRLQDQPIFFLVAQTDDYMETRHKSEEKNPTAVITLAKEEEVGPALEESATEEIQKAEVSDESPESAHDVLAEMGSDGDDEIEDKGTQIYSVATQKDIDGMVEQFKKRKQQHAMPTVKREKRKNPFNVEPMRQHRAEAQETKLPSVLKDHEAHVKVRTEMLLSAFDFFCQLDDTQFRSLLPSIFPFIRTLVAHGNDSTLRQTLAEFLDRLASLYSFGAESD